MAVSIADIAIRAKDQLSALTGLQASTVSSLSHHDDGWHIVAELVEMRRIPETADILATYEAHLDEKGNLLDYQRTRRYMRGQVND
jgi:hypothetical protein